MLQLNIDFAKPVNLFEDETKSELISFRVGESFKSNLQMVARAKGSDVSKLCYEYVVRGFLEDYKHILLLQANGTRKLRDLLKG